MMNKRAFTLSEVLIALGVVGVVAVLTIPGVMRNYQNRLYTAQLEKVYAQISDAAQAIMNDEHVDDFYESTAGGANVCKTTGEKKCTAGLAYFLQNYFKNVETNCIKADAPCLETKVGAYKTVGGSNGAPPNTNYYYVQTISGAVIGGSYNPGNNCTSLLIDVNGVGKPNVAGRDVFAIDIRKNGTLADYRSGCLIGSPGALASDCTKGGTTSLFEASAGCVNSIIEAGWKMEY